MGRYRWSLLWAIFVLGCSEIKQKEAPNEGESSSNGLSTYDSLLSTYGLKELRSGSFDLNVEMVIVHASVGSYFVYNLLGNDSTMHVKFLIVNDREVVLSFEKLLWEEEAMQLTDSLDMLLNASSFWELSNDKVDCEGADGTTYMLDIQQGENENQILRWSPVLCELPKGEEILRIVDYLLSFAKMESYETKYFY